MAKHPTFGMALGVASMGVLHRFLNDETGATAIEYGLIVAIISAGTVGGIGYYGESLLTLYEDILAAMIAAI